VQALSREARQRIGDRLLRLRNQLQIILNAIQESGVILNELAQDIQVTLADLDQALQLKSRRKSEAVNEEKGG